MNSPEFMAASAEILLTRMSGITKRFGHVTVLKDVQFEVRSGEVHVLVGENGAGKSTLIKILAGIHTEFEGRIEINGQEVRPQTPLGGQCPGRRCHSSGIVADRLHECGRQHFPGPMRRPGLVWCGTPSNGKKPDIGCANLVWTLTCAGRWNSFPSPFSNSSKLPRPSVKTRRIMVMDEPTSALNAPEVEKLFSLIRALKQKGCGIVYITHKMEEIERIADRITVLRDGQWIGTAPAAELPTAKLIQWMVGREMGEQFPRHTPHPGAERLRLENFSVFPNGFQGIRRSRMFRCRFEPVKFLVWAGCKVPVRANFSLGLFGGYGSGDAGTSATGWNGNALSPRHGRPSNPAWRC